MWYCAHAIFYFKYENQESYLLHENVYLINSKDGDLVLSMAQQIAKENEELNVDGHLEVNGIKAQYIFAGIRKIIQIELDYRTAKGHLFSGVEATYSVMEVDNIAEIESLVSGEATAVLYRE